MKDLLKSYGVVSEGHFKLTSGRHSALYIFKDRIYCIPNLFKVICVRMEIPIREHLHEVNVITGPAVAGAILAGAIADHYGKVFVYPEKTIEIDDVPYMCHDELHHSSKLVVGRKMEFRRGYDEVIKGKRVWITGDVITTGGSIEKTIRAIYDCGGSVMGVSAIWNRGSYKPSRGGFFPLITEAVTSYLEEDCPQCEKNIPLQDPKPMKIIEGGYEHGAV